MSNLKGPIFDAIKMICSACSGNDTTYHVFSYKNPCDFRDLWGLDGGGDLSQDSITRRLECWEKKYNDTELTVVIVWDGMPTDQGDPLNVSRFVSPHDWAMASSWMIYEKSCLKNLKLRILILNAHPSMRSFASDSLFAFQNALPWIQDYRVVGASEEAIVAAALPDPNSDLDGFLWLRHGLPPEYRDMEMFVKDLLNPSRVLTTHPANDLERKHYIELTQNLWIQNLLKAGNRHGVANLIAPTVLAWGLPNCLRDEALKKIAQGSLMRRALISTLDEGGFLKTSSVGSSTEKDGLLKRYCEDRGDIFGRMENIRFVLVDDHFDLGYHHILGYVLFGKDYDSPSAGRNDDPWFFKYGHSLNCYSSLKWLLEHLNKLRSICDWDQPRYLFENKCDVLFLDLRLWEDEDKESRSEEIKKICCAANKLLGISQTEAGQQNAAIQQAEVISPKFAQALKAAQQVCNKPDQFSPEALTLLPLLLSCIDRTLPIVLFTSSHQRVVSEMLQDFPNVITSFVKPLISGYGEEISPAESVRDLEDAIKKAIELHEARIAWKRICKLVPKNAGFNIKKSDDSSCNVTISIESREQDLLSRLADMFKTCVFGDSCYESIDEPWEFLESEISRYIDEDYESIRPINNRGEVANALKQTRIEKTHGKLNRDSFRDVYARRVALLQILFLLDFLEGKKRQDSGSKIYLYEPERGGPEYVLWCLAGKIGRQLSSGGRWDGRDLHKYRKFLQDETDKALQNILKASLQMGSETIGVVKDFTRDESQAWISIGIGEGLVASNGLCLYDEVKVEVQKLDENSIKLDLIEKTGNKYGNSFRFPQPE